MNANTATATLVTQIGTAAAAVMAAKVQKNLADTIAQQACGVAEEAAQQRASAKAHLDDAQRDISASAAVKEIEIAATNKFIMVAEVTYGKEEHAATTKSFIAFSASANVVTAGSNHQVVVRTHNKLQE